MQVLSIYFHAVVKTQIKQQIMKTTKYMYSKLNTTVIYSYFDRDKCFVTHIWSSSWVKKVF